MFHHIVYKNNFRDKIVKKCWKIDSLVTLYFLNFDSKNY